MQLVHAEAVSPVCNDSNQCRRRACYDHTAFPGYPESPSENLSVQLQGGWPAGPLAQPTRDSAAALSLRSAELAFGAGRPRRKAKSGATESSKEVTERPRELEKRSLAIALIRHCGQAGSRPDPQTSTPIAAPCQIRRMQAESALIMAAPGEM
jgi:hypothetical protein